MQSVVTDELSHGEPKVLASASAHGRRVELLEFLDGKLVITCDGAEHVIYARGTCKLESCIKSYLACLHSSGDASV